MTTLAINQSVESAVLKMISNNASEIVEKLAGKYGFDAEEALRGLDLPTEVAKKEVVPRKSKADKEASKKEKKEKKPKAKTGYLLFSDEFRAETRAELEAALEEGQKLMAKEVVSALGAKWKALSDEERELRLRPSR